MRRYAESIIMAVAIIICLAAVLVPHELNRYSGVTLNNNASNGRVVFTFDDGPTAHTPQLLAELHHLGIHAIMFNFGVTAETMPTIVREEVQAGMVIGDHTWDHKDFTGVSAYQPRLTSSQIRAELARTIKQLVADGVPRPTLWRPPDGDTTPADTAIATSLGLRQVLAWSAPGGNVVDSRDWVAGATGASIARAVTHGYRSKWYGPSGYAWWRGIRAGTVITFHDAAEWKATLASLPLIVRYMNAHHLGATIKVPANDSVPTGIPGA